MTANPLASRVNNQDGWMGHAPRWTVEDMHQWCAERNRLAQDVGWNVWYRVVPETVGTQRINRIETLEGWKATEARKRAQGEPVEYFRPSTGEAATIQREVAELIAKGVTPQEFERMNRRRRT